MGLFDKTKKKIDAVEPSSPSQTKTLLSSKMPIASLLRVFLFTSGDGSTIFNCPVAMGVFADTVGTRLNDVIGKVPFDIISGTEIGKQTMKSGQVPETAKVGLTS